MGLTLPMKAQTTRLFVGTTNREVDKSLTLCKLEEETGKISIVKQFKAGTRPGYLAIKGDFLYAVSSDEQRKNENTIRAFGIANDGNDLKLINEVSSRGINPCHVAIGRNGESVFTANYTSGSIAQYHVKQDGGLSEDQYFEQFTGSSVNQSRQSSPHAHYINATIDNQFVLTADLGTDKVMIHKVKDGKLSTNDHQPYFELPPGSGPRHLEFHPNNKWIYVLNELNSTLTMVKYQHGGFEVAGTVSTLPPDFKGDSKSAAVRLHPNGGIIYASNRGSNSISVFELDKMGSATMIQNFGDQLGWIRDFNVTPSGKFLVVGNAKNNEIVLLKLKPSGQIQEVVTSIEFPNPSCFVFYKASP
jgi:6-phosphogluconolactonase